MLHKPPRAPEGSGWFQRLALPALDRDGRFRAEEAAGIAFAFKARTVAIVVIAAYLLVTVPPPRSLYFIGVCSVFLLLGLVPYLLRQHPHGDLIKGLFILLDAALLCTVILVPPPFQTDVWPIQTRLRFPDELYLLVYLAGVALSFSPALVLWAGFSICLFWALGTVILFIRPDTLDFDTAVALARAAGASLPTMDGFLHPRMVSLGVLRNQVVLMLIITALLAAAVWRARRHVVRQVEAESARTNLSRYFSPDIVDRLAKSGTDLGAGERRAISVMFVDIVGFSAIAERLPPERVIALLRSFHRRVAEVVFRHGGTLDKYLGDGLMATFGTLQRDGSEARRALACALAIQEEVARWNAKRQGRGAVTIRVGVGVHHGPALVGNVGTDKRLEFTVVGDPVNVAARLERLTREHDALVAASQDALAAADLIEPGGRLRAGATLAGRFKPRGPVALRGRTRPVEVWIVPLEPAGS